MKHITTLILLLSTIIPASMPARLLASDFQRIQVTYEGEIVDGARLYNFSGSDYFSVKDIARIYKCGMNWHPVSGKVTLFVNNHRIDFFIKTTRMTVNGSKKRLSELVRASGDTAYIPASYIFSQDFARLTETVTNWNPGTSILSVEKKINVLSPRFYSYPEHTQVVVETLEDLNYSQSQKNPGVVIVSVQRGKLNEETIGSDDGIIREIDSKNKSREAEIRIYLTEGAGQVKVETLANPKRIVIDISRTPLAVAKAPLEAEPSTAPVQGVSISTPVETAPTGIKEPAPASKPPKKTVVIPPAAAPPAETIQAAPVIVPGKQKTLIVLDPGHGGDDPGAIGQNGTREKALNLAIIGELKQLFDQDGNYEVIVTRTDDTFIPLVDRTIIANEHNAHLFVSVHCNASINKNYNGFEIYFLSENASDTEAQATQVLENSVVRLEKTPTKKKAKLQELLWSLVVNEHMNESSEIASFIGAEVCRRTKIENRGVKQAGFYVLRGTQMPAVLVECAYLSNLGAEAKLNTKSYQRKIADGIYEGIKRYDEKKGI